MKFKQKTFEKCLLTKSWGEKIVIDENSNIILKSSRFLYL